MKYENVTKVLYGFGFTDIGQHDETIYGDKQPSRVIATKDGLKYYNLRPDTLSIVDVTDEYECTIKFICDKTVAISEPHFNSSELTIKRLLSFRDAIKLEKWLHDYIIGID